MKRAMVCVMAAAVLGGAMRMQAQGAAAAAAAPAPAAGDLTGNWQGTLAVGNGLRLLVKVSKGSDGKYKAVMYSIDQGGQALGANSFDVQGSTVTLGITGLELKYTATLSADGSDVGKLCPAWR